MADINVFECSRCKHLTNNYEEMLDHNCLTAEPSNEIFYWKNEHVLFFLSILQERLKDLQSSYISNKKIWQQISEKFKEKNWSVTALQCENKWRSLKKTYKKIKDHNSQSGNDRKSWNYYNLMDEILSDRPEIQPLATASSDSYEDIEEVSLPSETSNISESETSILSNNKKLPCKMRKRTEEEPQWFKEFREVSQKQHNERMDMQKKLIDVLSIIADKLK